MEVLSFTHIEKPRPYMGVHYVFFQLFCLLEPFFKDLFRKRMCGGGAGERGRENLRQTSQ